MLSIKDAQFSCFNQFFAYDRLHSPEEAPACCRAGVRKVTGMLRKLDSQHAIATTHPIYPHLSTSRFAPCFY